MDPFFWFFGTGMFLGGIGHLMFNYLGFYGKYLPWLMGIVSIYFVEKAMISLLKDIQQTIFSKDHSFEVDSFFSFRNLSFYIIRYV